MSALARHLARDLELVRGTRIASMERGGAGWRLFDEDGEERGDFGRLVIAMPSPQAAQLIADRSPLGPRAAAIPMQPCWAVMLGLAASFDAPFDGAFCEDSALAWIARDSSKPGRPAREAWVLHASSAWSEAHLDAAPEVVVDRLSHEVERVTGASLPEVAQRAAHLWRFARPGTELTERVLEDRAGGIVLAGDAYCGGRVEGAYLSGVEAARRLA